MSLLQRRQLPIYIIEDAGKEKHRLGSRAEEGETPPYTPLIGLSWFRLMHSLHPFNGRELANIVRGGRIGHSLTPCHLSFCGTQAGIPSRVLDTLIYVLLARTFKLVLLDSLA